jgi:rubrerythrin
MESKKEQGMEIFSFGMQMELDGKAFYTEQASKIQDANIAHILTYLADEEQKHYDFLKKFRDGSKELPESRLLRDVRNVFQEMKDADQGFVTDKDTLLDILHKAMVLEDKSVIFYRSRAEEASGEDERDIFLLLKKHEDIHYSLLSSLIEYYDRPSHWLEDAEFTHLEDY